MTDDNNDPWRSLADELGVQPGEERSAPPPPPPSAPNPPAAKQRSQPPHSAPPKKSKSDWNALAGELGLEVSADDESPTSDHDPVAEILGFPPPGSLPQRDEPETRRLHDEFDDELGEEFDRSANRDRWRDEDDQQRRSNMYDDTRPVYDDEPAESNDRGEGQPRDRGSADEQREYRPRRRGGRGGRGRGRGGDRSREGRGGSRYGHENRERRSYDDQRSDGHDEPQSERQYEDEPREGQSEFREARPEGSDRTQERSRDERSQRRRRGRRGRGRGRERDRSDRRPYEQREESNRSSGEEPIENLSEDLFDSADVSAVDFPSVDFSAGAEVFGSEADPHEDQLEAELAPTQALEGAEHDDDVGLSDADDNGNGKSSVRDILTWKEAIGMIIDGNMQSRAESPQSQQHSRPSRGRGRGRGGRGGRGGGHRH